MKKVVQMLWREPDRFTGDSSKGFTLVELLVYMMVLGIVVLIAGQAFSDSTKMRVRTESMLKSNITAEQIGAFIRDDVAQMGAKTSESEDVVDVPSDQFVRYNKVYIDPDNADDALRDKSSFSIESQTEDCSPLKGCGTKSFMFRRIRYDSRGMYEAVEEITWSVSGKQLIRSCKSLEQASTASDLEECPSNGRAFTVTIADNIERFKVIPAKPGVISQGTVKAEDRTYILPNTDPAIRAFRLIPRFGDENFQWLTINPEAGGEAVALSGFATNYDYENARQIENGRNANQVFVGEANGAIAGPGGAVWKNLCKKVSLLANVVYEISFSTPYMNDESRMFCPGRDHAAVGFRDMNGKIAAGTQDFAFYFPTSESEPTTKKFQFSLKNGLQNVCMAFTFANYSPIVSSGSVVLQNILLKRVANANYDFSNENYVPIVADKALIQAFRIDVSTIVNKEFGEISLVIPVPNNGL